MKIGYLIGALGSGGSERQLSELAVGMAVRGHTVEVLCYDGSGDFDAFVEKGGATVRQYSGGVKLTKLWRARKWIGAFRPDVLHGFMKRASSLAILANLPGRRCRVVGSDFSTATYDPHQPALRMALQLFRFSDRVATQTEVNRQSLVALAPWLQGKVVVVRNGVDTERFRPREKPVKEVFRFLCVGTVWSAKNPLNIVKAAGILRKTSDQPFELRWVGRHSRGPAGQATEACRLARAYSEEHGLTDRVTFPGEARRVEDEYCSADALLHASVQDGIPNAVVEGMACGLPLVVSRVSDLPLIVRQGRNGFVCDPLDPGSIAEAMKKMLEAGAEKRLEMGHRSRSLAVDWFARQRFIRDYEALYLSLVPAVSGPAPKVEEW